ncbi:hypothetical protein ACOSQ4_009096 [Xanthoceras sorbifolium]
MIVLDPLSASSIYVRLIYSLKLSLPSLFFNVVSLWSCMCKRTSSHSSFWWKKEDANVDVIHELWFISLVPTSKHHVSIKALMVPIRCKFYQHNWPKCSTSIYQSKGTKEMVTLRMVEL